MESWCPKCDWYKGKELQCPRCGFNEKTRKVEKLPETKPTPKKAPVKKTRQAIPVSKKIHISPSLMIMLLITGGIIIYAGTGMIQKSDAPISPPQTQAPLIEDKAVESPAANTAEFSNPHELLQDEGAAEAASGWTISSATLSPVPTLHFIGVADFNEGGTYKINTHPQEFDPIEGRVEYTGTYTITGREVTGRGTSTIYQRGSVFGSPAVDTMTAQLSESGAIMEGQIISLSSLHSGGGEGNATFTFVLEKTAQ